MKNVPKNAWSANTMLWIYLKICMCFSFHCFLFIIIYSIFLFLCFSWAARVLFFIWFLLFPYSHKFSQKNIITKMAVCKWGVYLGTNKVKKAQIFSLINVMNWRSSFKLPSTVSTNPLEILVFLFFFSVIFF